MSTGQLIIGYIVYSLSILVFWILCITHVHTDNAFCSWLFFIQQILTIGFVCSFISHFVFAFYSAVCSCTHSQQDVLRELKLREAAALSATAWLHCCRETWRCPLWSRNLSYLHSVNVSGKMIIKTRLWVVCWQTTTEWTNDTMQRSHNSTLATDDATRRSPSSTFATDLLLLVCVSFTIIGQPWNSVLIRRV